MSFKSVAVVMCVWSAMVQAQTAVPVAELPPPPPPPMLPASPPPMPATDTMGTPPPPSNLAPGSVPYSPYGQPRTQEKPGPEVGLMLSESLFGALTAAGVTVLPYFLLFSPNGAFAGADTTLSSVIFILIFSAAPLAVAQTQVGLANGSRYYRTETWIPALVGLAGEAGVLGIYAALNKGLLQQAQATTGGTPSGNGSVVWLMIGSIGVVPLLQMAAINLFKESKMANLRVAWGNPDKGLGVALAPPSISPVFAPASSSSAGLGVQFSLLRGQF